MQYYVNPYRNGYVYYPSPYSFYWVPQWGYGGCYPPMQGVPMPTGTRPINYRQQNTVDSVPLSVQTLEPPRFSFSYPYISKEAMQGGQGNQMAPPQAPGPAMQPPMSPPPPQGPGPQGPPMQGPFMQPPVPNPPPGRPPQAPGPFMQPPMSPPPPQGPGPQGPNRQGQGNNLQAQGTETQQSPMAQSSAPARIEQDPPRPPRPPMQQPPPLPQPPAPPMQPAPFPQGPGPVISGSLSEEVIDRINDEIREAVLEAFGENVLLDVPANFTEIYNTYEVTLNQRGVLSILFNMYTFMQGAANGNNVYYSITLNTNNGEEYDFEDLFNPRINYIREINQLANAYISDENIELIEAFPGVTEDQQFYLTPDSLVLYYQPGLYTAAYRDLLKIEIPYEDIQNLITPLSPISRLI